MTGFEDTLPQPEEILFPLQDLYPEIQDWILDDIIGWIQRLWDQIYLWFEDQWNKIVRELYPIRDRIISELSSIINSTWDNLRSKFHEVLDTLSKIWDKLCTISTEIISSVSQFIHQITSYIDIKFYPRLEKYRTRLANQLVKSIIRLKRR